MGLGTLITGSGSASGGSSGSGPVGNVTAISVSGIVDPVAGIITLVVSVTPPAGGSFVGCELYLEIPDQSANPPITVGTAPIGGSASITTGFKPIDLGSQQYAASTQPWTIPLPCPAGVNPNINTPCRLYANSFSASVQNPLVEANQSNPTPNQAFELISLATGSPTAGTNITTLTADDGQIVITASVLSQDFSTGVSLTPVEVLVSNTPGSVNAWCYRIVTTPAGTDPTQVKNQTVASGINTQAGQVPPAKPDGIAVPHTFTIPTPSTIQRATVWLQAGIVNAAGVASWNNIVPGITPGCPITYGSTIGTLNAAAILTSSIAASMAVVGGLFGVAAGGITNPLLGSGAVATINVQNLAITNPLLSSLCVQAAQLASGSVTATAIAALAVGTAAIQTGAITNALIANLAVSNAQIQNATITGAKIANATIGDANIASCNISKLVAGTATFTGTVGLQQSAGGPGVILSSSGITLAASSNALAVTPTLIQLSSGSNAATISATQIVLANGSGAYLQLNPGSVLIFSNNGVTSGNAMLSGSNLQVSNSITGYYAQISELGFSMSRNTGSSALSSVALSFGGTTVVRPRQTGPGSPSGFADSVAQAWCQSLYSALAASSGHGLIN